MNSSRGMVYQLNLSPVLGGAEVFTGFFSRALSEMGWPTELIVSPKADYWKRMDLGNTRLVLFDDERVANLPDRAMLVIHAPAPEPLVRALSGKTRIFALAHQALYSDKQPSYYRYADTLIPVSNYVAETLRRRNYSNVYPVPLYGIGCVSGTGHGSIFQGPGVDWDRRKLRDRVLSTVEGMSRPLRRHAEYKKRPGLTLGIVSRIAEAKQFPALFANIAEHIRARPEVWIEVFGSAVGFRALREFRRAVAPIKDRVRYWGLQNDVASVYRNIDYLITGLPEREALGLNVIEAQMCGTPVLAPRSAPFTETVIEGKSGYLYLDPRQDGGQDFARVLDRILQPDSRPDPLRNTVHLAQFEFPVFCQRVDQLMNTFSKQRLCTYADSH